MMASYVNKDKDIDKKFITVLYNGYIKVVIMSGFISRELTNKSLIPSFSVHSGSGFQIEQYSRKYSGLKYCDWVTNKLAIYCRTSSYHQAPKLTTLAGPKWKGLLPPKQILILPAGCELKCELKGEGSSEYTALYLDYESLFQKTMSSVSASDVLFDAKYIHDDEVLFGMIAGVAAHGNSSELFGSAYTETLISCIGMQLLQNHSNANKVINRPKGGLSPTVLRRIKDYIKSNISTTLSLDELSVIGGLSSYHMARSFKKETGETIHGYIIKERVQRATELLKNTDSSITTIAYDVGYVRTATMNHNFLTVLGMTPRDFRNLNT